MRDESWGLPCKSTGYLDSTSAFSHQDSHTLYNRPGGQPDAQDERRIRAESSKDAPGTRQLWEPFPSALLEQLPEFLSQQRDKGEAEASQSMDALLPIGLSSSSLPNMQPMRWPDSVRCNLAPVISLPEEVDRACLQARSLDQVESSMPLLAHAPQL